MVLKPGARARRFTATEDLSTDRVSFVWRARFPMLGPISLRVSDSYQGENGLLEVRLGRLPTAAQARSRALARRGVSLPR